MLETRTIFPLEDLELRQRGGGRTLSGRFPYRSRATVRDRGRVRKERFRPRAFRFAVEDPTREINLLAGHDFNRPLGSKLGGSLTLEDSAEGLAFRATLPPIEEQPSWMRDQVLAIQGGLVRGVSPGFRVPPAATVPNAEVLIPEPGNPSVQIRDIAEAVLFEMSPVTRAAYTETTVAVRSESGLVTPDPWRNAYRWL